MNTVFITKFEWLNEIHMFYVMDSNKTNNKILRNVAKLTKYELNELEKFSQRIHSICQRGYQRKVSFSIGEE